MLVRFRSVGPFAENSYVVGCRESGRGVLVDPGGDVPELLDTAARHGLRIEAIWLTHAHVDHVAGVPEAVRLTAAPVALHPDDRFLYDAAPQQAAAFGLELEGLPEPDVELVPGQELTLGEMRFGVLPVPGHSPGHVAFWQAEARAVLSGDCLFAGSIGRTDLPGGDASTLLRSIESRLLPLGDDVRVYPGHGPPTTIERERRGNPFLAEGALSGRIR